MYLPAVSNIVTNGNGTGNKYVLKGTVRFGLSLVSSLPYSGTTTAAEVKLFSVYCKLLLYVNVEINPLKHWCVSNQTNLCLVRLVYVTMFTGTRSESTVVRVTLNLTIFTSYSL